MNFNIAAERRFDQEEVQGYAQPPARSRAEGAGRSRRIHARAEVAIEICRGEAAASGDGRLRSIRLEEVRKPGYVRADSRLRAAIDEENDVVACARGRKDRDCHNKDLDREERRDREADNRVADKDREERNGRAKKRRRDREGEDLSEEVDRVDIRRADSRPYDRRRVACNRAHRVRRVVGSDRSDHGRRRRPFFLPFRDPPRRGRRHGHRGRHARDRGSAIFRRRYRVR